MVAWPRSNHRGSLPHLEGPWVDMAFVANTSLDDFPRNRRHGTNPDRSEYGCGSRRLRRPAGTPAVRAFGDDPARRFGAGEPDVVRLGRRAAAVRANRHAAESPQSTTEPAGC